jgi:uncharacterized membrane protein (UPF0127 family)
VGPSRTPTSARGDLPSQIVFVAVKPHNLLHVTSRITVACSGHVLANEAQWARTMTERRRGLIGSPPLKAGQALIIIGGWQVHTFRMDFPIDVVFCNKKWIVKHVVNEMAPSRVSRVVIGARYAIELPAGSVPETLGRGTRLIVT